MPSQKILNRKMKVVDQLADELKQAKSIVLSNYQGLTVAQDTEMRAAFRKENVSYRVVKNTITKRALEKIGLTDFDAELAGPTAIAWSVDDVVLAPRMVKKFADQFKKTEIKGGVVEGEKSELEAVKALAEIPSIDVLYGRLVSTLIFPVTSLAMTLNAIAKKKEENGEGAPAAETAAEEKPVEEAPAAEAQTVAEAPAAEEAAPEA